MNRPLIIVAAITFALVFAAALVFSHSKQDYGLASSPPSYGQASAVVGSFNIAQNIVVAPPNQAANAVRTAVVHAFTLQMPADQIEAIYLGHLDECARLGCTVVNSHLTRSDEGPPSARASIRIAPTNFLAFEKRLTEAPVHILSHSQASDDKAIAFLDLEKRIEAKAALRDRLLALLKDSGGKATADLLAVEKELTQVQGDIEAATAQRDYLRTITETVRVDISYMPVAAHQGAGDLHSLRLKDTFLDSAGILLRLFAGLVTLLAGALPWLPLLALLVWGGRRAIRRWPATSA